MTLSLTACGTSTGEGSAAEPREETAAQETPVSEEDQIVDEGWEQLESLGKVETENGLFFVRLTLPKEFVGEEITQEKLDAETGTGYLSAKLNEDGSVTYKMTKKQHKAMLDEMVKSIDDALNQMVDSSDYSFAEITHNKDFTSYDVKLDTDEIGFAESFMTFGFFMYSGFYAIFTGKTPDNVAVNFYRPDGSLIDTVNSKDLESSEDTSASETGAAADFDGSSYSDMGQGTFGIVNASGSTLKGEDIVVYVDNPDNDLIQIGFEGWDFNGAALTYIYIDGKLNSKEQIKDMQGSLTLVKDALKEGTHLVEAVQFENDDPAGTVTVYKSAQYTVKLK